MVTKEGKIDLKNKQHSFVNANNHGNPYYNLNLNENYTSSNISFDQSCSKTTTSNKSFGNKSVAIPR